MGRKVSTSFKLPATLEQSMLGQIVNDGYGFRGKSRWINEAIEAFITLPKYHEYVKIADEMESLSKIVSIRAPEELMDKIELALVAVRKIYPSMEGVKSNIIRASIMQRLVR